MVGLVLEGGGAKGAYQIGAYKALLELNVEIGGIAGTSIGALNGAMIVQDEFEKVYMLWEDICPSKVFDIDESKLEELRSLEISHDNLFYFMRKAKDILTNKGMDITFLKRLLQENINEDKLRKSNKEFGIVTISLTDMKPLELFMEDIPRGKVIEYLLASAQLPAFKREKVDGKYFLDGGFFDNLPINLLIKKGYTNIVVIRTGAIGRKRKANTDGLNVKTIKSNEDLGPILDFDRDNARKNLKLGYYDTLRVFNSLKGFRYYVRPKHDEDYFMDYLLNLGEERILRVGKLFGYTDVPYKRLLFEFIIPKLTTLLEIPTDANYEDVAIRLIETVAEEYGVERFALYDFEDFLHQLARKQALVHYKAPQHIPSIVKKIDLLAKAMKDEVINEVVFELFGNAFTSDCLRVSSNHGKELS